MDLVADGRPFLAADCTAIDVGRSTFRRLTSDGSLRQVYRGCWVDARVEDTRALRLEAIGLVRPQHAVACGETAAFLFGLDVHAPLRRHDVTPTFVVPIGRVRIERPGVSCREAILPRRDVVDLGTVPVTSPIRTTSDLLRGLYRPHALAAADAFAHAGLIETAELVRYVSVLRGYRWIVQARQLAALVDPASESPGESWTRLRIHDAGFPPPRLQWVVELRDGRRRRLDLAYPKRLVGCEFDGRDFHTAEVDVEHDVRRRDELTREQGWRWVVATRDTIFGPDPSFEVRLGELLGLEPRPRTWGGR